MTSPVRTSRDARVRHAFALLAAGTIVLSACATSSAGAPGAGTVAPSGGALDIRSGADLVTAMRERYASSWYETITFVQRTVLTQPNGVRSVQTWWEAGRIPGFLRIDTDSVHKGSGVLFRNDSVYTFASRKLVAKTAGVNELLVLGFDVYRQPVERSLTILRGRGFDLSKVHETTWRGTPVWVVGALAGDTTSKQFWVEKNRLLFVRLVQRTNVAGRPRQVDLRFDNYVKHGGGWVAEKVVQLVDARPTLEEVYSQVRVDVPLADALFVPEQWSTAAHWARD